MSEGKPLGAVHCDLFADKAPQAVAAFVGLARGLVAFKTRIRSAQAGKKSLLRRPAGSSRDRRISIQWRFKAAIPGVLWRRAVHVHPGSGDPGLPCPMKFARSCALTKAGAGDGQPRTEHRWFAVFITVKAAPWLSGQHTIFGQCDNLPLLDKSEPAGNLFERRAQSARRDPATTVTRKTSRRTMTSHATQAPDLLVWGSMVLCMRICFPYGLRRLHDCWRAQVGREHPALLDRYDAYQRRAAVGQGSVGALLDLRPRCRGFGAACSRHCDAACGTA